ncbi:hypothetical protein [Paracidovorax wautersii]|uniref:hypothetical protein n=1 Tax=Paracidovorax wautersii TaxID=1177982 RepID=UPI001113736F|nr:hypothetical protein [Paracidovorax wautersii]
MRKQVSSIVVAMAAIGALVATSAHAGFTISVKPLPKPQPVSVLPPGAVVSIPVDAARSPVLSDTVKFKVARGSVLKDELATFLSQFGWTPAWMAGDLVAGDAMVFEGKDQEEALSAFLAHYQLVGERFAEEKGYVIRRSADQKAGAK